MESWALEPHSSSSSSSLVAVSLPTAQELASYGKAQSLRHHPKASGSRVVVVVWEFSAAAGELLLPHLWMV